MRPPNLSAGSNPPPPPARLIIAEPEELTREALGALVRSQERFLPVGLAADGEEALDQVTRLTPDVAVVSLDLARLHTLEMIGQALNRGLTTRFLILAGRYDRKTVLECLRAGAQGFALRSGSAAAFLEALDQVLNGGVYLAPQVSANRLFLQPGPETDDPIGQLSSREYQVFTMLVDGVRAKEIAARLDLSPKTVDTYRASLMRKLDIHDVAGLVKFALRRNLLEHA